MKNIKIKASKEYEVLIGDGLIDHSGEYIKQVLPKAKKAAIISDDNVAPFYLERIQESLANQDIEICSFVLEAGEKSKNGEVFLKILNFLAANSISRSDVAVALGGGVVGDVCGFTAASYLRGIAYVQIPTSLLAMVDSSVGGKTAINLDEGKNLAGAFWQPELVLCDLDTLNTLPPEYFSDGCAEVLKYGILGDNKLFTHLLEKGQNFDREYVVSACVEMKRDYVCADEFDRGLRQKLNLGHTFGHAVEKCSGYAVSHGCAVAIGMAMMARTAAERGFCSENCASEIIRALECLNLPTKTEYSNDKLLAPMLSDKKCSGGSINLIVPREIGKCDIVPVEKDKLKDFISWT